MPGNTPTGWQGELAYLGWNEIVAQQHAKRAVEIALCGGHTAFLVGNKHSQCEDLAAWARIFDGKVYAAYPCPCGWLGDGRHECTCGLDALIAYQQENYPAYGIDIWIEMPRVGDHEIEAHLQRGGEPWANVEGRIIRTHKLRVHPDYQSLVLDEAGMSIMRAAERQLGWGGGQAVRVVNVARTIATAACEKAIRVPHLAEAIQYCVRTT